jgi:hypothetical protein
MRNHYQRKEPQRVRESRELAQFIELGKDCPLLNPREIFISIHQISRGMPCNGCSYGDYQDCAGKKRLYGAPQQPKPEEPKEETVREMASRLNISISEVRRRRRLA